MTWPVAVFSAANRQVTPEPGVVMRLPLGDARAHRQDRLGALSQRPAIAALQAMRQYFPAIRTSRARYRVWRPLRGVGGAL